ncbi:MAG: hypothetical protein ABIS59_00800 [Candidatus Saccharibacteria bacterium]
MSGIFLLEDRKIAAAKLIELTSELATSLELSSSRLPKKMNLEAQRLARVDDRKMQLRKLDMIHDFASLLCKLLPGIATELKLDRSPIQECLDRIQAAVETMSRS